MKYVIRSRLDGHYLVARPQFGRFLHWAPEIEDAFKYPDRKAAEDDASFAWMAHWQSIVDVLPVP
jgi:hypothetical protein